MLLLCIRHKQLFVFKSSSTNATTLNSVAHGSSHVIAATVPNCRAYDPTFAYELAVILDHGMREMLEEQRDVFYYVTLLNENYAQPSLPEGVEEDLIRGAYRLGGHAPVGAVANVRLLGSGAILREVIAAAELLARDWNVASDVYSVTSFSELARDAAEVERWNRLHPDQSMRRSHVDQTLAGDRLIVAATDYVRAYPQLIAPQLRARYVTLGTDGFGRSDTRAAVRRFFEVDRASIVLATLSALAQAGEIAPDVPARAIAKYEIPVDDAPPWKR